ncbi:Dynamin-like GTPase that mediates homotypic ER fusion [Vanrija albida]|uniref:Dynamin-like GTPase that mediates homotypic ER fusion n=1 Tax=Vanrija albida TaxID=181172 RepID=A0ABR3QAE4_9TREE
MSNDAHQALGATINHSHASDTAIAALNAATAPAPASVPATAPAPAHPATAPAVPALPTNKSGEGRLQIVNEQQVFSKELPAYLSKWGLLDKGFAYDVVAVFGSQSTGKSTLLNRLFGTTFDVMDEAKRQQTTKGIWMCPSAYSSALVMDVEGTDGRERGEDQDFERKSALFSLASTEVLIVNLWEHQIGLYQGANMGLLKTVFEVNLSLFGGNDASKAKSKDKTLILFVIRDHVGATPLSNLTATLTADMEKIWASLSKPPHLADTRLTDYFDLSFAALPHKILLPEKFEEAVVDLRKRFTDRTRPDYVFQPAYHKRIPADGVGFYMEGIWDQVVANKDLDLPTQQELLAQFRCDEIAATVSEVFATSSKAVRKPVEAGTIVDGLGGLIRDWLKTATANFDVAASRYHAGVYQRKRQALLDNLHAAVSPLFLGQLKNAHKAAAAKFIADVTASLKAPTYDFAEVVTRATKDARDGFLEVAKEVTIDGADWEYQHELDLLNDDLKVIADKSRADETKKLVNNAERAVKRQLLEPVELALSKPSTTMWDKVLTTYRDVNGAAEKAYLSKAKSYNCTEEENATALHTLRSRSWLVLRKKLEEQTADATVLLTLRESFEERFRYDDNGVPRVWKPEDDLEGAYKKARDETLALLPLFATIKPKVDDLLPEVPEPDAAEAEHDAAAFDPDTALVLVTPTRLNSLESRFKREADAAFVEAKRSMVSSVSQIPYWMYGLLVVLGWNEAMAVLFNPLYFAMLVVLIATAYIVLQLGLAGPLLQVSKTVAYEVKRIGTDKLREAFAEPPASQRVLTEPVAAAHNGTLADEARRRGDPLADEKFAEK